MSSTAPQTTGVSTGARGGSYYAGRTRARRPEGAAEAKRRDFPFAASLIPENAVSHRIFYGTKLSHRPSSVARHRGAAPGRASGLDPRRRGPAGADRLRSDHGLDGFG